MIGDIKPIAQLVGEQTEYAAAAAYVTGLDMLPLGRVVNNEKVTDHHAIIPTNCRAPSRRQDGRRRPPRSTTWSSAASLRSSIPEAVFENTRVETTGRRHISSGRVAGCCSSPGWRGVYGEGLTADANSGSQDDDDEGGDQQLPRLEQGEESIVHRIASEAKETKPPRRYSDGSLLDAMETAGKLVDDEELREAMKDSGIGTPRRARRSSSVCCRSATSSAMVAPWS